MSLRDKFSHTDKEKIPPDLRRALSLLNLTDLAGLEERFLATTAFLEPWAAFRDCSLLINNSRRPQLGDITRLDILWYYTQFDEGVRRHDPRTEKTSAHFAIDKSEWGPAEFEKHLYVWLLQTFCVGKAHNPFDFRYFELRNICTAWEEVLVPIIKAVRASYSVKGRRHYGRLALFIEDRCPSRLAFPEGNVNMPNGVVTSPTPFRMVSRPAHLRGASQTLLTRKNYDEAEKELRDVYPQYGGLVERPRFKQKMDEWLEEQRVRAVHRKTIMKPEVVQYVSIQQSQVVQQSDHGALHESSSKSAANSKNCHSPVKRYSDTIRRSLSMNTGNGRFDKSEPLPPLSPTRQKTPDAPKVPMIPYGMYSYVPKVPKEEPKSPLHGVTRQILVPDDGLYHASQALYSDDTEPQELTSESDAWPLPAPLPMPHLPRPELPKQQVSKQSMYTTVHNSHAFAKGSSDGSLDEVPQQGTNFKEPVCFPMGASSGILLPLSRGLGRHDEPLPQALLQPKKSTSDIRHPSYEGSGYQEEISLTKLHARTASADSKSIESNKAPSKPRSRLPAPIKVPPPYVSQLRVASNETYRNDSPPKPHSVPWPGFEDSPPRPSKVASAIAPPIPVKSPERGMRRRGQRSDQILREAASSHEMTRIVSKENIRAALGGLSRESSMEDIKAQAAASAKNAPSRVASPPRLEAYNTHMFPRKDARSKTPSD